MIDTVYLTTIENCVKVAIASRISEDIIEKQYLTERIPSCSPVPGYDKLQHWLTIVQSWSSAGVTDGIMTEDQFQLVLDEISLTLNCR